MSNPSQETIDNAANVCLSVRDQSRLQDFIQQSAPRQSSRRHESAPVIADRETPSPLPFASHQDCGLKTVSVATSAPGRTVAHSDNHIGHFRKIRLPAAVQPSSKSEQNLNSSDHGHAGSSRRATVPTVSVADSVGSATEYSAQSGPPVACATPEESSEDEEQEEMQKAQAPELSVTPGTIDRRCRETHSSSRHGTHLSRAHLSAIASNSRLFIPLQSSAPYCSSSNSQLPSLTPGHISTQKKRSGSCWTFDSAHQHQREQTELDGSKQLWGSFIGPQLVVAAVELKRTDYRISLWTLKFYSPEIEAEFSAFSKRIHTFPLAPFKWTLVIPIISQLIMVESSLQAYKLILTACPNVQGTCILCQSHVWTLVLVISALLITVLLFTSFGNAAKQRARRQRLSLVLFVLFVMVHLSGILCGGLCRLGPDKDDWTLVDGTIQLALTCAGRDPEGLASQGLQWLETSFQTRITSAYSYIYLLLAATQLSFMQVMGLGLFLLTFLASCIITVVPSTTSLLWLFLASLVQDVCKAAIATYQRDLLARACFLLVSTYQTDSDRAKNSLVVSAVLQQPLPQSFSAAARKRNNRNVASDSNSTRPTEPPQSFLKKAENSGTSTSSVRKPDTLLDDTGPAASLLERGIFQRIQRVRFWFYSKWDSIVYRFPEPEDEVAYVAYYRKKLVMRFRVIMVLNMMSSVMSMVLIFAVYQFLEPLGDGGWLDNWVLTDGVDVGVCLLLFLLFKIIRLDVATRIAEATAALYAALAIVLAFANSMRREVFQHENRAATLIGNHRCLLTIFTLTAIRLRPRIHFFLLCLFIFMLIVERLAFHKPSPYFTLELQGIIDMGTLFGSGSLCLLFEAAQRKYYLARSQYAIDAARAAAARMADMSNSDESGAIPSRHHAGMMDMKRLSTSIAIL